MSELALSKELPTELEKVFSSIKESPIFLNYILYRSKAKMLSENHKGILIMKLSKESILFFLEEVIGTAVENDEIPDEDANLAVLILGLFILDRMTGKTKPSLSFF